MARRFFGEESPLGHRLELWNQTYEIVGLVENAKYGDLRQEPPPTVFLPYTQAPVELGGVHFAVRSAGDPAPLIPNLRRLVREIDPDLPLIDLRTQSDQIEWALMQERLFARLSGFFGLLGLLITLIGLYGLLAYSVSRRTSEIGLRMALGADRGGILRMVVGQGLQLTLIGIGVGLAGVVVLTRYLESFLYGISPTDLLTLASVAIILLGVALLACLFPAHRAAKVDPLVAMRYE